MEIANLVAVYEADTKGFDKGTDHVEDRMKGAGRAADQAAGSFNRVGSSLGGLGTQFSQAGSQIGGFGTTLTYAVSAPIAGLATLGIRFNMAKETALTAFGVMLKSGEAAKQLYADLLKFGADTPFEVGGLATATKALLAFGVGQKDVLPTLRNLGDIASGTGTNLNELAEIYGKARVQGRLFAQDVNQFTGRGIPIIQELAKQFGVADSDVKKLVEDGKVGFPQLEQAFKSMAGEGGQFFGMMDAQSKTFAGRLSTLWDTINMSLGAATEGLFTQLSQGLGDILPYIGQVGQAFATLGPGVQTVILVIAGVAAAVGPAAIALGAIVSAIGAIATAAPTIGIVAAAFAGLAIQMAPLVAAGAAIYAAWQTDFGGIRELVGTVAAGIQSAWDGMTQRVSALTAQVTAELVAFWAENGEDITKAVTTVSNNVTAAWQKVVAWWNSNMPAIRQVAEGVWQAISGAVLGAVKIVTGAIKLVAAVINGDWNKVWEGTKVVLTGIVQVWGNILVGAGKIIVGAIRVAFNAVWSLQTWLLDQAMALGKAVISGLINGIKNSASLVYGAISDVAHSVITTARGIFQTQSPSKVFMAIGKDVALGFIDGLQAMRAGVGSALADTFDISRLKLGKGDAAGVEMLTGLIAEVARLNATWKVQQVELDLTAGKYGKLNEGVRNAILNAAELIDRNRAFSDGLSFFTQQYGTLTEGLGPKKTAVQELNDALAGPGVREAFDRMTVSIKGRTVAYGALLEKLLQGAAIGKDALAMNFGAGPPDSGRPLGTGTGSADGVDFGAAGKAPLNIPPPPIAPWETFWGRIKSQIMSVDGVTASWKSNLEVGLGSALMNVTDIFTNSVRAWDGSIGGFFKNVGRGFVQLGQQILDQLLRIAVMQSVLKIIGAVAGSFGGGASGAGSTLSDSPIPGLGGINITSAANGGFIPFDRGGYTGPGSKNQVAGIVHGGEFVFSKKSVNRLGIGLLSALHDGSKGYYDGGLARAGRTPSVVTAGTLGTDTGGKAQVFNLHYHPAANGQFSKKSAEQHAAELINLQNRVARRK